jgi:hypothetical protein
MGEPGRPPLTGQCPARPIGRCTGGMKLRVWMSAPDAEDMDVFVAVQKLEVYVDLVGFP